MGGFCLHKAVGQDRRSRDSYARADKGSRKAIKAQDLIVVNGDGTMNEVLDGASFHGPLNLG